MIPMYPACIQYSYYMVAECGGIFQDLLCGDEQNNSSYMTSLYGLEQELAIWALLTFLIILVPKLFF